MVTRPRNKFTIRVKVIDEKYFISGLNEAANRLTTGLILVFHELFKDD